MIEVLQILIVTFVSKILFSSALDLDREGMRDGHVEMS